MPHILVIEDDTDLLFLYATALAQAGFEVQQASNGKSALALLQKTVYDLLIVDLNLPDIHGSAIIEDVLASEVLDTDHIIVITANDHQLAPVEDLGIMHIMVKPVSMADVVGLVGRLCGQS
ncbi:MAG: response regulator transcription factor [Anaerolineales bacterium]